MMEDDKHMEMNKHMEMKEHMADEDGAMMDKEETDGEKAAAEGMEEEEPSEEMK